MAAPFLPPGIKAKASRPRIPVSDEERTAARAGMGGEKTAQAKQAAATPTLPEPVAPVTTESAAPDVAPTQLDAPVAVELVASAVEAAPVVAIAADAEPTPTPTLVTAPAAASAPVAAEPTPEPMPTLAVATEFAAPTVTAAAAAKPIQPTATAAPARRGRKPTVVAPGSAPVVLRSLKVPEGSWLEIKVVVAQLSAVEDVPHNIQTYIEAAHKHYEAYLRKQGKLPAK